MAASTTRKQNAAATRPTGFPPTTTSESPPAVCALGPLDSANMPIAKSAGSPAPASRPNTRIFQSAAKLIQADMVFLSVAQAAAAVSGSAGAAVPVHSSFTLVWSTLFLRDRQ